MPFSVLIIDDSDKIRKQIIRTLMDAALFDDYREAADGLEGFKSLVDAKPDLVICDVEMPRMDGFRFLQMVNSREGFRDIPIIILTGNSDQKAKVRGLELGACDYVTKPFDAAELVARVRIHLQMKQLQDELWTANRHLKELAITDPLTSIYNRRFATDILDQEFQRAERSFEYLSLIIFDVDHFKDVNDRYGHPIGDKVLVAIAEAAQKNMRSYDVIARYGGEEFLYILPGTHLYGGALVAERLRKAVEAIKFPPPIEGLSVTVSLGVAAFPSLLVDSVSTLIHQADYALYQAKQNGRNRVELAEDSAPGNAQSMGSP